MIASKIQYLLISFTALFAMTTAVLAQSVSPDLFGALPTVSHAVISPDGKTIAQVQADKTGKAVAFYDIAKEKQPSGVAMGDVNVRTIRWAGPNHVIALVSGSRRLGRSSGLETYEFWRWISINRNTGDFTYLFDGASRFDWTTFSGRMIAVLPDDPNEILMGHYSKDNLYSLFRVDLDTGKAELDERGEYGGWQNSSTFTVDWVVKKDGTPIARVDYNKGDDTREFYRPADNHEGWELASSIPEKESDNTKIELVGGTDRSGVFHALAYAGNTRGLYEFDINTGTIGKPVITFTNFDVNRVKSDPQTARAIGAFYTDDMPRTQFFDQDFDFIQNQMAKAIPGAAPELTSWSADYSRYLVKLHYADHPPQFFLFDKNAKSLSMVATSYAGLDGKVMAKSEKFDFVAPDGLVIPGFLTVPTGSTKQNMPLIVLPHGGPWARDDMSFDWWSFFYASRGYLVYQPNFRGSDGYGTAFRQAGNGEWGRKMQDDITNGVKKLIADGTVDPDRICIAGGSYGGYAALAGAILTPELYKCAVSVNGVSNLLQLMADRKENSFVSEYWKKRIGSRFTDEKSLRAVSPLYQISARSSPIMLIHGTHDTVVPIGQSQVLRRKMRDMGLPYEYVELEEEDHWLSTGPARTEMLARSIEFIDRHIGQ